MRLAGKQKLGYFPLPLAEAERIRHFLQFPLSGYAALDPCIGDGGAFTVIAGNPQAIRYGIELDAYRVEQAREVGHHVIHGDALDVHCPVESLSLLYSAFDTRLDRDIKPVLEETGGRALMMHTIDPQLLERPMRILVVGCGGNGSAIVSGLPYLHQAMLAFGHPGGLQVTLIDPDTVSETNCVRQPFCRTEIGFPKAIVLAHRINLFWGLNWQGMQARYSRSPRKRRLIS